MKHFVNSVTDIPKKSYKPDKQQVTFETPKTLFSGVKLVWMIVFSIAIGALLVFILITLIRFLFTIVPSSRYKTTAEVVSSAPAIQEVIQDKLTTTSNTITDEVVYVEFLDKLTREIAPDASNDISLFKWSGAYLKIPEAFKKVSDNLYQSENESISFKVVEDFADQLSMFQGPEHKDALKAFPDEAYAVPVSEDGLIENQSTASKAIVVWEQKTTQLSGEVFQTVIQTPDGFISLMSSYRYMEDIRDAFLRELQLSTPTTCYDLNGEAVDRQEEVYGYRFLVPHSASDVTSMSTHQMVSLGSALSENPLYIYQCPNDTVDLDIPAKLSLAIGADNPDSIGNMKLQTDVYATWLNHPGRYVEYELNGKRVCGYIFNDTSTEQATFFGIFERDNKFPYMLRYLNTMALEIK
ncbi:MAG: hypothetical protein RSC43_00495 [Clostridia bacterium]